VFEFGLKSKKPAAECPASGWKSFLSVFVSESSICLHERALPRKPVGLKTTTCVHQHRFHEIKLPCAVPGVNDLRERTFEGLN
jgi:hypothetical protein